MTDMDAVFMALAELAKQSREQAAEIAELKSLTRLRDERLDVHRMLLTHPSRRDAIRHYAAQLAQAQEAA